MNSKLLYILFAFIVLTVSCEYEESSLSELENGNLEFGDFADEKMASLKEEASIQSTDRKLIKTGNLSFETESLDRTVQFIRKQVLATQGYISSERGESGDYQISNRITLRVPAENFDALIEVIEAHAGALDEKSINTTDVTEQFLDVQTRMVTKKKVEQRYLEILKRAQTVKEILEVENQIGKIRVEIESMEGKLKYFGDQTAMSTVSIYSFQKVKTKIISENTFSSRMKNGLQNGIALIQSIIIGLVTVWPLLLIGIAILLYLKFKPKRKAPIQEET